MAEKKPTFAELNIVKSLSEAQLKEHLESLCKFYNDDKRLVSTLKEIIDTKGLNVIPLPKQVILVAVLAIILGDIGTQMSPQMRNQNIQKLKNICITYNINYEIIKSLTEEELKINSVLLQTV